MLPLCGRRRAHRLLLDRRGVRHICLARRRGVAVGLAVTLLANAAKDWVSRHFGEETGSHILVSLLIPFVAYLLAVRFQASGILAAVTAGIAMNREERAGAGSAGHAYSARSGVGCSPVCRQWRDLRPARRSTAGIVTGAQRVVRETGHQETSWLLFYILAINCALLVLRALWAWTTLRLILFRAAHGEQRIQTPGWRLIAATSLAGVRGALTLSGVMALPLALPDGASIPRT